MLKIESKKREDILTPREIVKELDRYIVGQDKAKKAVAIALRNRWRRLRAPEDIRHEITPNNILMIGPTGVGKTEIARRLASLANAPFVKVEATRFTEVGYVGRDVESMIRELVEISINAVKKEKMAVVEKKAEIMAEDRIIDVLYPVSADKTEAETIETREKIRNMLKMGQFDDKIIEIEVDQQRTPFLEVLSPGGTEELNLNVPEGLEGLFPTFKKRRKVSVKEAMKILTQQESQKLIDMDEVIQEALRRVEVSGIVFIDEIDKVIGARETKGPDVSREGVQRDLLPIVEGTSVMTKYGMIRTDHILFISAGAFHNAKPSDLIPELQGRFPIRVELSSLSEDDFARILVEPENSLVRQYTALLASEGVRLNFKEDAIRSVAYYAYLVNSRTEDIGARRLHTVMSLLLEDILFELPKPGVIELNIDKDYVEERLSDVIEDEDLTRYIL